MDIGGDYLYDPLPGSFDVGLAASRGQTGGTLEIKFDNLSIGGTAYRLGDAMNHVAIVASPNPFGDRLTYRLEGVAGAAQVRLLDMTGRVIVVETLDSNVSTIDGTIVTREIAAGVYLLEVKTATERQLVKVVKR